jgi:hypothetical protein
MLLLSIELRKGWGARLNYYRKGKSKHKHEQQHCEKKGSTLGISKRIPTISPQGASPVFHDQAWDLLGKLLIIFVSICQ